MKTGQLHKTGSPDLEFGLQGQLTLSLLNIPAEFEGTRLVKGLALQPDGKIIVGAELFNGVPGLHVYALMRLHDNGALDDTFATKGITSGSFLDGQHCGGEKVMVLPDGKLQLLGWTLYKDGWAHLVIARFDQEGNVDGGFGDRGQLVIESTATSKLVKTSQSLSIDAEGKFWVTANYVDPQTSDHFSGSIFSINPDGDWNTDFNRTGRLDFKDTQSPFTTVNACLPQDGRLLIAGNTLQEGLDTAYVARLTSDGQLDDSFGDPQTQGMHTLRVNDKDCRFNDLDQRIGGSLACFGQCGTDLETESQGLLTLLTPDGKPDQSFNEGNPLLTQLAQQSGTRWRCGYVQANGCMVALSGDSELYLARVLPQGIPDKDFGNLGQVKLDNADLGQLPPFQLIKRSDNRILLSFNFEHLDGLGRIDSYLG